MNLQIYVGLYCCDLKKRKLKSLEKTTEPQPFHYENMSMKFMKIFKVEKKKKEKKKFFSVFFFFFDILTLLFNSKNIDCKSHNH